MNRTSESILDTQPSTTRPGERRRRRWWMPLSTLVLGIIVVAFIRSSESIEANFRWAFSLLAIVLMGLLLLVWFMFFSSVRWRIRLVTLAALVLCGYGLSRLLRFDGSANGAAFPRVVWKWTPKRDGNVGGLLMPPGAVSPANSEVAAAVDYPGFLGGRRDAIVEEIELERDWNARPPELLWRQPIGLGWSAFAVAGPRAVTQEQRGENELVVCYELATGRPLWAHTNRVHFSDHMGGDGPRATPTIAAGRVYALGATGILDCLDLASGRVFWSRDTLSNSIPPMFGKASSPLVFDDLVVVTGGRTNGPSLLAYRRDDGSPSWRSGTNEVGYTSPVLATLAGTRQIISLEVGHATAHDPADGHILWDYHWKAGEKTVIASEPIALGEDRVLLSAGFLGVGCVMLQVNVNDQGKFSVAALWSSRNLKTDFSTANVRDGFAYGLDDGILACIDLATGRRQWKDGRYGRGQLMRVGDLLLVQTEPGPVVLVEANPAGHREVARLDALSAKTWNNPALAGQFLLVRNDQEAACYRVALRTASSRQWAHAKGDER